MAMNRQSLSDITRGLQHAAQTTLSVVAEQFIRTMEQFFDPLEDGTLRAKTVRVEIGEGSYVMVPLVALVTPRGLAIDRMRVSLSVRVEVAEAKKATSWDNSEAMRTSFGVSIAPRGATSDRRPGDVVDVELEFKALDAPESMMRLIDLFANAVTPFSPKDTLPPTAYAESRRYRELVDRYRRERGDAAPQAG